MHWTRLASVLLTLALVTGPSLAAAENIVGLTTDNRIFLFDSATPGATGPLVPVTGLQPGTSLVGIDFRPATPGVLVGVGQTGGTGAVYQIDPVTGTAVQINTIPALTGTTFGVDFNPVPNALRIVSDANQNLRITLGGAGVVNVDGALNSALTADPNVVGAAYSNNVAGGINGRTTLYDIDSVLDQLLTQGTVNFAAGDPAPAISPNTGTLLGVGPLGVNTSELVGFDISAFSGTAFASLTPGLGSGLYTINLATGAGSLIGAIDGGNLLVRDIAVANVPLPATLVLLAMGAVALAATARVRRGPAHAA
jgi:Domain of unknown function (DUF4394)